MFFSLVGRHGEYKSRALKIENFDLHGLVDGRSLRKSKNCVGLLFVIYFFYRNLFFL